MKIKTKLLLFIVVILCILLQSFCQVSPTCSMKAGVREWLDNYERHLTSPKYRHFNSGNYVRVDPKEKVRYLGKILKCYVESLRAVQNRQVELIFLIDSSSSIGEPNFKDELKFVKKLLADFTVDQNNTRVSVVTFSSRDHVVRHIDHLAHPDDEHHKCSLLDGLHTIGERYRGGGTYTKGALIEAKAVFWKSRPYSKKAVFLITDGFSNYGTPVPAAEELKRSNVEIFTFGIKNGNPIELLNISSHPKIEHTYILDSFEEFEALARRALHKDLHAGTYLRQIKNRCDKLCSGSDCCDSRALCACGTHTGKYECMCVPGYYGNGLRGECTACPAGTYKNYGGPGDIGSCKRCPDPNHTSYPGGTSVRDCRCVPGFTDTGQYSCAANTCPVLSPPPSGYFVQDNCNNVVHAACGIRCKPGYKLQGSSVRLCQENGTWTGTQSVCVVKKCQKLHSPQFGHMMCSKDDFSFETVCQFSCYSGFKLYGSMTRTCLAIAFWNGIPARCKEVRCTALKELTDGRVDPPTCTTRMSPFGSRCTFTCRPGYKMIGPYRKQCTEDGVWTPGDGPDNKCIDIAPPNLQCPMDVKVIAEKDENYGEVSWEIPFTIDNSGYLPTVTSIPALVPPSRIPIGKTTLTYVAEDNNGNKAKCNFHITVIDHQPPRIDVCTSPPPFIKKQHIDKPLVIDWDEPLFSDNSQEPLDIRRTHKPGQHFELGYTRVMYTAIDRSSNNVSCVINIIVKEHACANPPKPVNGEIFCSTTDEGLKCNLRCLHGFAFVSKPPSAYYCNFDTGEWSPADKYPFPDCSVYRKSNNVIKSTVMKFKSKTGCEDRLFLNQIETMIQKHVSKSVHKYCEPGVLCSVENFYTDCIGQNEESEFDNELEILTNQIGNPESAEDDPRQSRQRKRRDVDYRALNPELHDKRTADISEWAPEPDLYETGPFAVNSYYDYLPDPDKQSRKDTVKVGFDIAGKTQFKEEAKESNDQAHLKETVDDVSEKVKADLSAGELQKMFNDQALDFENMAYLEVDSVFTCPLGGVLQGNVCVKCPVGTFFNVVSESCEPCTLGTYQSGEGKVTCLWCPTNTSTSKNNSKAINECKAQCLPGSFSASGLEICETCPIGFYQPQYATASCTPCPLGSTTWRRGTRMRDECGVLCPRGEVSKTGLHPCFPCPRGYFQPDRGKSSCFLCPGNVRTEKTGSTNIKDCIGISDVSIRKFDSVPTSELVVNECFKAPCQNQAKCVTLSVGYICECLPGWTGIHCEKEIEECASQPCEHNATCTDLLAGYNCSCALGFTGINCEINMDDCMAHSCYNNATCIDDVVGFHCLCPTGFTGDLCEVNMNDCAPNPCGNGTCVDEVASFTCVCSQGFTGQNCEVDVDECFTSPCYNNATCIDSIANYICHCVPGYTGAHCGYEINECLSSPCHNGATCFDQVAGYNCRCPPSYTGNHCQEKLPSNFDLVFPSSSVTDYSMLHRLYENLTAVSLGFWMKTFDNDGNYGTVLSYAVGDQDNAFTLMDYSGFVLYVNGERVVTDLVADDSRWHHLFVSWSSDHGDWQLYQDGLLIETGTGLANGTVIQGGGVLVLGQEQDSVGGDFSAQESYVGNLTAVNMWNRNLTVDEIQSLVWGCDSSFYGNVVAWSDFLEGVMGHVYKKQSEFCTGCLEPVSIDNGTVKWNGLTLRSQANYTCDPGFEMDGPVQRECLIDSTWSGTLPRCKRKKCSYPGSVRNARLTGFYYFGDSVTYKCETGYKIQGNPTIMCTENTMWNSSLPSCVEITCKSTPNLLYVYIVNKKTLYNPGHRLKFSCHRGRNLYGPSSITCDNDGEWDGPFPSCDQIFCYEPPEISNGHTIAAKSDSFKMDDYVLYECDRGYSMSGLNRVQCLDKGLWSSYRPRCVIVQCEMPPGLEYGQITPALSNYTFGMGIEYSCLDGYKINGTKSLTCTETGMWNFRFSECVPKSCEVPESVENGFAEAQDEKHEIGSQMEYKCYKGHEIEGNATRICLSDETWSGVKPLCKPIQCATPPFLVYGTFDSKYNVYASEVLYKCKPNYDLLGNSSLICNENGTWSGVMPICLPRNCSIPTAPENGRVIGIYNVGSTIEYLCSHGYQVVGDSVRKCLPDLTWEGDQPHCEEIQCPVPVPVEFGGCISTPPHKPGTVIKYTCEKGYEIDGKDTRTCRIDGTWTGPVPQCTPVTCKLPKQVSNGKLEVADTKYGSTLQYVCDQGYEIEGSPKRTCNEDKDWTGSDPVCGKSLCPPPQTVNYGVIKGESHEVGAKITYECNEGYDLIGVKSLTCLMNKVWSGQAPECKPVECDQPASVISNGRMISREFTFGCTIHYVCDSGYFIDGPTSRTCKADKSWDNPIPVCDRVECPRPLKPPNCRVDGYDFRYKEHLSYICRDGYQLVGPNVRTCQADKTWSGSQPNCVRLECVEPAKPENGKVLLQGTFYQNVAKYQCFQGYWLVGNETRVCQNDRTWSGNVPRCELVVCGTPPEVDDTEALQGDKYSSGQVVEYKCKLGYILVDPSNLTCSLHGNYTGKMPRCVKIICHELERIENGHVLKDSNDYGEGAKYVCKVGYNLIGNELRKCTENATWSGTVPRCELVTCQIPSMIKNGYLNAPDGFIYDKLITFTCKEGFDIKGSPERKCLADGTWSGEEPTCVEVACTAPAIDYGYVTVSAGNSDIKDHVKDLDIYVSGITINFACEEGYDLWGPSELNCLKNKSWDGPLPTCERVKCPEPDIENAVITATHGFVYNHRILIKCEDGYDLKGSSEVYCMSNRSWSEVLPMCEPVTCDSPSFQNGNISVAKSPNRGVGYAFGLALKFHCYPGYILVGEPISTCSSAAKWSPEIPICTQYTCSKPLLPYYKRNGLHIIDPKEEYSYKEKVRFGCNTGYEPVPTDESICSENKRWSDQVPKCESITCEKPEIENGVFHSRNLFSAPKVLFYNTELTVRCEQGYALVGAKNMTCLANKSWSAALPKCIAIQCSPLIIPNSEIFPERFNKTFIHGENVTVYCEEGFELLGSSKLECLANGSWSAEMPSCSKIQCLKPNIPNAMIEDIKQSVTGRYTYTDVIKLSCYHGFVLNGISTLTCKEEGKWSFDLPVCDPIPCPNPSIENGYPIIDAILNEHSDPAQSYVHGTIICFECNHGYKLVGHNDSICQETGTWLNGLPKCELITCPKLNVSKSVVNSTSTNFGSAISVTCAQGYEIFGDSTILCGLDGTWRGLMPVCQAIFCPNPSIEHGIITGKVAEDNFSYGDNIDISCDEGFHLIGDGQLRCLQNRTWSAHSPQCERLTCLTPPLTMDNGRITVNSKDKRNDSYETAVNFACELGYALQGNSTILCQSDRTWTTTFPKCIIAFCPTPYVINGFVRGSANNNGSYTFGDSISFHCNDGYTLVGEKEIFCQPNLNWTGIFPICLRVNCGPPKHLDHGYINGSSYLFEDKISFSCSYGYELSGLNYSSCLASKDWSEYPVCQKVTCPYPSEIDNGEFMSSGFKYEDNIKYSCDRGYELIGQAEHFCHGNKSWSGNAPVCEKVECVLWPSIANGRFSRLQRKYYYQDEITITCNRGYVVQGSHTLQCQSTGSWPEVTSKCNIIKCVYPSKIQHGNVMYTSVDYGSVITYECDQGNHLAGVSERRCLETGYWSDKAPVCDKIRCPQPNRFAFHNGFIIGMTYTYLSTLEYKCNSGYMVQGKSIHICQSNGRWSYTVPRCIPVDCRQPPGLLNGRVVYTSTIYKSPTKYQCNQGYNIKGTTFRTCLADGAWSGTQARCEKVSCPIPVDIDNGYYTGIDYTFASEIVYHCKEKYDLEGSKILVCGADGRWTGTTPHCRVRKCKVPDNSVSEHVIMVGDDFSSGSSVTFQCDEGYQLIGEEKLTCQDGANWDGQFPQCDKISCGLPKLIDNGMTDDNSYEYKDVVKFRCVKGYKIDGIATIECQANGKWSQIRAKCIPISCNEPPNVEHASYVGDSFNFGDYISYRCDNGFEMTGSNLVQCIVDGVWEGILPSCHTVSCGNVPVIHHASTLVAKTTYGSKAMYECNKGYKLVGSAMVECIANGTWQYEDKPKCIATDCGVPNAPINGGARYGSTALGSTAEYYCKNGYILAGNAFVSCISEDGWNGTTPRCLPVSCSTPVAPRNGVVEGTRYEFSDKITYSCTTGYLLIGGASRVCEASGDWSGNSPICQLVECPSPGTLDNGQMLVKGYNYKSVAYYECDDGYQLVGNDTATCTKSGQWSSPLPVCAPSIGVPCPPPPHIDNIQDVQGVYAVGDTVTRTCSHGFIASGDLTTVCQQDYKWTALSGQCAGISCGLPTTDRSVVMRGLSLTFNVGDRARYICRPGLAALTPTIITCQSSGQWDYTPLCKAQCKFSCENGGQCVRRNTCKCRPGWGGRTCKIANCILSCQNGGKCTAPYQCTCLKGYTGTVCEKPVCEGGCKNGGTCVKPDRCTCLKGFKPPFCDPYMGTSNER